MTEPATPELEALQQLADTGAGAPPPTPEELRAAEHDVPTADLVWPVVRTLADVVAPGWALTDPELQPLAGALARLADKYLPGVSLGPELETAICLGALVMAHRGQPLRPAEAST